MQQGGNCCGITLVRLVELVSCAKGIKIEENAWVSKAFGLGKRHKRIILLCSCMPKQACLYAHARAEIQKNITNWEREYEG